MILAGVDEAGLGPTLGPLVTACAALRVPDGWDHARPWDALADAVTRTPSKRETRLPVGDSKAVHARLGVAGLARTLAAFLLPCPSGACGDTLPTTADMLDALAPSWRQAGAAYPWYADFADSGRSAPSAPVASGTVDAVDARPLMRALEAAEARVVMLRARPLLAGAFNDAIAAGRNKAEVTIARTGQCLAELAHAFPDEPLTVMVDRQGGRAYYHAFLTQTFPGAWIDILGESAAESAYRVRRDGGDCEIRFRPKADADAFCVALASMAAKWTRESFMAPLNAWFAARVPGLRPTAGYPEDAKRFLADIAPLLADGAVDTRLLIRCR